MCVWAREGRLLLQLQLQLQLRTATHSQLLSLRPGHVMHSAALHLELHHGLLIGREGRQRRRARRRCRTGVVLKGHEVLFGGNTEGGDAIRDHKRKFRCLFVGFEDRGWQCR